MTVLTGPKPDYTTQDASTYKANIDNAISDLADNVPGFIKSPPMFHAVWRNNFSFEGGGYAEFTGGRINPGGGAVIRTFKDYYNRLNHVWGDSPIFQQNGLAIDGPRSQILSDGEDLYDPNWVKTNVATTGAIVLSPFGYEQTDMQIVEQPSGTGEMYITRTGTITNNATVTFSAFVRTGLRGFLRMALFDSIVRAYVDINTTLGTLDTPNGGTATIESFLAEDGQQWYIVTLTATMVGTSVGARFYHAEAFGDVNITLGSSNNQMNVWFPTLEESAQFNGILGHSNAPYTLYGDGVNIQWLDNLPIPNDFSIAIDVSRKFHKTTENQAVLSAGQATLSAEFLSTASDALTVWYNNTAVATTGWSITNVERLGISYDGVTLRVYRDGVEVGNAAISPNPFFPDELHVGWDGTAKFLEGNVRNMKVFDHALNAIQMRLV